ncbi:MAG: AIR synthase-related protein, partial [Streptosporangiaceae bacterium]
CLTGADGPVRSGGIGCTVDLGADPFTALFSESPGRALVAVRDGQREAFARLCAEHGVPAQAIGITGGAELAVDGVFSVPLGELAAARRGTLGDLFG